MKPFNPSGPPLVISTHLDDAVLSCAEFLSHTPESVVLTVLAGAPNTVREGYNAVTTGESNALDAVNKRKSEDSSAMAFLSVRSPEWLDLFDSDFLDWNRFNRIRHRKDQAEITSAVGEAIKRINPGSVISPLGLVHRDHLTVANACLDLSKQLNVEWYLYMDMPYAQRFPKLLSKREAIIRRSRDVEALEPLPISSETKHNAFRFYTSQYVPLGGGQPDFELEMMAPERYWRVLT